MPTIIFNPLSSQFDYVGTGGTAAPKYSATFNATSSWTGPSGGYYSYSVTAATHGKGTTPAVQVLELVSGNYNVVSPDTIQVDTSGNVIVKVPSASDNRFAGLILIS